MWSSSPTRFELDARTGIFAARTDPSEFVADSDPNFEQILATDTNELELEVRGDLALMRPASSPQLAAPSRGSAS
jgi:hypothetical protein